MKAANTVALVCECEAVTAGEVAVCRRKLNREQPAGSAPSHPRRDGHLPRANCAPAARPGYCSVFNVTTAAQSITQLSEFLNERWKGVQPVAWGDALRESEFTRWVYQGLCGLEKEHQDEI